MRAFGHVALTVRVCRLLAPSRVTPATDGGPVALQVRYDLGLTKSFDASPQPDIKTEAWLVSAGFRIPLKKK